MQHADSCPRGIVEASRLHAFSGPAMRLACVHPLAAAPCLACHLAAPPPPPLQVLDNLRDFAKAGAFKRAALEAIAFSMSAQSIKHLREQFSKMDKDQSGFVSVVQFMDALIGSGIDREEVRRTNSLAAGLPLWELAARQRAVALLCAPVRGFWPAFSRAYSTAARLSHNTPLAGAAHL